MLCGTPNVTTPIGAEGMHGDMPWAGAIEQSASAIAAAAVELYQNPQAWQNAQQNGQALLQARYLQSDHGPALVQRINACRAGLEQHRRNNFTGAMLRHHQHKSTQYMSQWIEAKNSARPLTS